MDDKLKAAFERVVVLMAELDEAKAKVAHLLDVEPREKTERLCGHCGESGHNKKTCPQLKNGAAQPEGNAALTA